MAESFFETPLLGNPNGEVVVSLNGYKNRGFNHTMQSVSKTKRRGWMYHEWRKGQENGKV